MNEPRKPRGCQSCHSLRTSIALAETAGFVFFVRPSGLRTDRTPRHFWGVAFVRDHGKCAFYEGFTCMEDQRSVAAHLRFLADVLSPFASHDGPVSHALEHIVVVAPAGTGW